ncbi:MAG: DUF1326 domain-containing protein [Armatimonadota bacterium]
MTRYLFTFGLIAASGLMIGSPATAAAGAQTPQTWSATGTLLESCTCAVPCTCNFGEGPSPHPYCHAVFSYQLEKASWNGIDLSGLIVGGADGPKGIIGFIDERATPEQKAALESLARAVMAKGGPAGGQRRFVSSRITHTVQGSNLRLDIPGHGGFTATVITGMDGKSPIVVENNTVWPIPRAIKAKAKPLAYRDNTAGTFRGDGTNANYGKFTMSGPTGSATVMKSTRPLKSAKVTQVARKEKTLPGCCALGQIKKTATGKRG